MHDDQDNLEIPNSATTSEDPSLLLDDSSAPLEEEEEEEEEEQQQEESYAEARTARANTTSSRDNSMDVEDILEEVVNAGQKSYS